LLESGDILDSFVAWFSRISERRRKPIAKPDGL